MGKIRCGENRRMDASPFLFLFLRPDAAAATQYSVDAATAAGAPPVGRAETLGDSPGPPARGDSVILYGTAEYFQRQPLSDESDESDTWSQSGIHNVNFVHFGAYGE
ncbi:hypothetical protein DQ04_14361000 [Trypanosoma grayi]|uniref:hypothetical protein n=1 Tax=Trypanosoma grayi TaxID=71804 RepID=UPI0004F40950|nr:hypothetical protein DQ04_14361000 [Trypanosoma grayi]KEG06369.1 hypothetical protein DQ04_14361000 [Trypanosoma grayi]